MKLTIPRKELLAALKRMDKLAGSDGLAFCPLYIAPGFEGLTLRRTSPTCQVSVELEAAVESPEAIQVDFGHLLAAVASLGEEITLQSDQKDLRLSSGSAKARLSLAKQGEVFRPLPCPPAQVPRFDIGAATLVQQLKRALRAASANKAEERLNGVAFHTTLGEHRLVSTDRRRAYLLKIPAEVEGPLKTLMPREMCLMVISALGDSELTTECRFGERSAVFTNSETEIITSLSENLPMEFAEEFFNREMDADIHVRREDFLKAVRQVNPFGSDDINLIQVRFGPSSIELFADSQPGATMTVTLDGKSTKEVHMSVNAQYLSDLLQSLTVDDLKLQYYERMSCLFVRENDDLLTLMGVRTEPVKAGAAK